MGYRVGKVWTGCRSRKVSPVQRRLRVEVELHDWRDGRERGGELEKSQREGWARRHVEGVEERGWKGSSRRRRLTPGDADARKGGERKTAELALCLNQLTPG